MQQKLHGRVLFAFSLLSSIIVLVGCTSSSSTGTLETGYVTEATVTETIESSGSVSAKQLAALNWATTGNVLAINVQNNDQVVSGDELMKLDSTTAPFEVLEAISTLVTAKQNLANVEQSETDLAEAEVALIDAQTAYNSALKEFNKLDEPLGTDEYIAILQSRYLSAQNSVERAFQDYNRTAELAENSEKRISAAARLAQARIDENDALIRLNHFRNPPAELEAAAITAAYNLAKAILDQAQLVYNNLKSGNSDAVIHAQAAVDVAQAAVNKLGITAPFDGEIAVVYSQVGDFVSNGSKALVLVDRSKLTIDVLVEETAISRVEIGNPAAVTFSALGIVAAGKVTLINPVGANSSGVVNYTVRIELDEANPDILIGATGTVVVTTGEPQNALYVPVSAVLTDDQGEYVTRLDSVGSSERVTVVTSDISDGMVKVSGDLQSGEMVQLYTSSTSETTSSADQNRTGFFGLGGFFR